MDQLDCDFVVLGSGVAGLYAAWQAAASGRVVLVTNGELASGSSYWAQGGIAAVTSNDDTRTAHIDDTLAAGRGLCDPAAVEVLVREGAAAVERLIEAGMDFDRDDDGTLRRGLEGGHSHHRVLHALGVQTGKALVDFLIERVNACDSVTVVEHGFVHELLCDTHGDCAGITLYRRDRDTNLAIHAPATILATGGYSGLYARTTNPPGASGFGLSLAQAVGARWTDLEFVQFHPTAFFDRRGGTFLISEALRGAGATLVNEAGQRFLAGRPQAELAPRDVVASAITAEIAAQRASFVGLDLRHLDHTRLHQAFGFVMDAIAARGIDATRQPVPVAPAAHYCIGGIATDLEGATNVAGLYAAGEVAATGVHGANRLASNSLLECLVFAERAVAHAAANKRAQRAPARAPRALMVDTTRATIAATRRRALGSLMTTHVGIERHTSGLNTALARLESNPPLDGGQDDDPDDYQGDNREHEYFALSDRALHRLAYDATQAALRRSESIGVHQRRDDRSVSPSYLVAPDVSSL